MGNFVLTDTFIGCGILNWNNKNCFEVCRNLNWAWSQRKYDEIRIWHDNSHVQQNSTHSIPRHNYFLSIVHMIGRLSNLSLHAHVFIAIVFVFLFFFSLLVLIANWCCLTADTKRTTEGARHIDTIGLEQRNFYRSFIETNCSWFGLLPNTA